MTDLENTFFESYKKLDKYLCDMYSCTSGVTKYIEDMENTADGRYYVGNWDDDYKTLKHLRWIRTQIAHDTGDSFCEQEDLYALQSLYRRFFELDNPMAQYRKAEKKLQLLSNRKRNCVWKKTCGRMGDSFNCNSNFGVRVFEVF